jgi:uncharacterized protein YkwD
MTAFSRLFAFLLLTSSLSCHANEKQDVKYILKQINHYRMTHLRLPLHLNSQLNHIAKVHSNNMASHQIPVGHIGFEKRFSAIRHALPKSRQAAENVASGYKSIDAVVQGWIHSPGHRQNILGMYNVTGIAISYDKNHTPYYTQVFAKNP